MWSDNEAKADLLRFKYLSSSVCEIIRNDRLSPTTIGLFGDWGSGKSTLLKLSKIEIEKDKTAMWVEFNGWLFEGYADARSALMGTILDQVRDRIKTEAGLYEKTKDLLSKLSKRVNWFSVTLSAGKYAIPALMGAPHLAAGFASADVITYFRNELKDIPDAIQKLDEEKFKSHFQDAKEDPEDVRKSIIEFRQDFAKLMAESKIERLIVSIDDLDRCLPDTVIETLEAIRLFLLVPKTVFIIAADERLVEYAVTKRFPGLPSNSNLDVGREYLEKMVQIPIRVPPLGPQDVFSYMNLLMAERAFGEQPAFTAAIDHVAKFDGDTFTSSFFDISVAKALCAAHVNTELEDDFRLVSQIAQTLALGLSGSPRRIKRFLNTLILRMKMAKSRGIQIQRATMAKLMLLEYIKGTYFKELANLQAKEDGRPAALKISEAAVIDNSKREVQGANDVWIADEWMRQWLKAEPHLSATDLKPYFYIAHDTLGLVGHLQNRMSPRAQGVLARILSEEDITRKKGAMDATTLSDADINSVFEEISDRLEKLDEIDDSPEEKAIELLYEHVPSLIPQVISLYKTLPHTLVPEHSINFLEERAKNTPSWTAYKSLLQEWAQQNEKKSLKRVSEQRLQKLASQKV